MAEKTLQELMVDTPIFYKSYVKNVYHDLKRNEYTLKTRKDGTREIWMPCPLCGVVAHCSPHNHRWYDVGTSNFRMLPSLKCTFVNHSTNPCGAHYFIQDSKITNWQSDTFMPPKGYWSNSYGV